jgi:hypothetical protein
MLKLLSSLCSLLDYQPIVSAGPLNSLFLFNLSSQEWGGSFGVVKGSPPPARHWHGFVAAEGKFYVYGGMSGYSDISSKISMTLL